MERVRKRARGNLEARRLVSESSSGGKVTRALAKRFSQGAENVARKIDEFFFGRIRDLAKR
jgi:hypothetical protein